jgi:hypothetical protein
MLSSFLLLVLQIMTSFAATGVDATSSGLEDGIRRRPKRSLWIWNVYEVEEVPGKPEPAQLFYSNQVLIFTSHRYYPAVCRHKNGTQSVI